MDIGLVMVGFLCVWLVLVGVVLVLADAGGGLEDGVLGAIRHERGVSGAWGMGWAECVGWAPVG